VGVPTESILCKLFLLVSLSSIALPEVVPGSTAASRSVCLSAPLLRALVRPIRNIESRISCDGMKSITRTKTNARGYMMLVTRRPTLERSNGQTTPSPVVENAISNENNARAQPNTLDWIGPITSKKICVKKKRVWVSEKEKKFVRHAYQSVRVGALP
jgi:hypothetical protein